MHLTQSIFRTYSALRERQSFVRRPFQAVDRLKTNGRPTKNGPEGPFYILHERNPRTLGVWVIGLVFGFSAIAAAQTDPLSAQRATARPETNPVVISVQASQPATAPELARAIQIMLDISRDDLAVQYIGQLEQLQADDSQWYGLMREFGSEFVMRLATYGGTQPAGRQLAEKILVASGRFANNPARLKELTQRVVDPKIVIRSAALEDLQSLGEVGAAALLNALADESRQADQELLRAALARCSESAVEPVLGGIQASDPRLRMESVRAARFLESNDMALALLRPALAENTPADLRREALDSLHQLMEVVPERAQAAHLLKASVERSLSNQPQPGDQFLAPMRIWRTHPQGNELVELKRPRLIAQRIEAAERAEDLIQIRPETASNQRLYALALLEAAKYVRGFEYHLGTSEEMHFARQAGPDFMEQVLAEALKRELIGASAGACEILGKIGDQRLLSGDAIRPLVAAASASDRRVQFAACDAIMAIEPTRSFPGSSAVAEAILSLAQSRGRAKVLVGHPNVAYAQNMANTVELLGFEAESVSNGQELVRRATEDGDVEFVVLSEALGTPTYQDLISQLRAHPRTQRLPIALQFRTETIDVAWQADAARVAVQIYLVVDTRQFENYDEWLRRTRSLAGLQMPLLLIVKPGDTETAFGWAASDSLVRFLELETDISPINKNLPEQVQDAFRLSRTPVSLVLQPRTVSNTQVEVDSTLVLDPREWVFWPQWTKQLHDNLITNRIDVVRANESGIERQIAGTRALDQASDTDRINIDDLDFLYSRVTDLLSNEESLTLSFVDSKSVTRARQMEISDPWVIAMPWTIDRGLVARQMDRLTQLASSTPVNSSQRNAYAGRAMEWLAHISADPAQYPFWELTAYDQRIGSVVDSQQLTPALCQTLGNLGTPLAQQKLMDIASQEQLPTETRQAAVESLERAFGRHGILLTTQQIRLQYDRYNASERLPEETQQILGAILNAIERPTATVR